MEPVKEKASRFLLDTHALLWWLFNDNRLSRTAFAIIQSPDNRILVSSASGWEIATKHRLGKLPHAGEAARNLPSLLRRSRMDVLPITMEHALAAGALPGPHRDPFDRMLIAQGQIEGLPIVTTDPAFKQYPVTLVW
ncbi:MAG: type II toxin-antitoxin system VapC family toxin [Deltaproteobacteria bacterium]|nr:type II toxin-antitoxin system VapC family toxin [Deltaproteobacteria bacterium]MBW2119415.1 type II toxin-antitoxin system VapC family toxin [Deltaproteobacteria bacterium]